MNRIQEAEHRADRLPDDQKRLYESLRRLGMSPNAALDSVRGRGGALGGLDAQDEAVEGFERLGLTTEAARTAVEGRDGPVPLAERRRQAQEQQRQEVSEAKAGDDLSAAEVRAIRESETYWRRFRTLMEEGVPADQALARAEEELISEVQRLKETRR